MSRSGKYTPSQDRVLIEALRDLKVKQEELCRNERMTRKHMVSNMRVLQEAKVKEINEVREKERIAAGLNQSNHQQLLQLQSSKKKKLSDLNTKLDDIEQKEAELQSHLKRLEEQLLQQQQFASLPAASPSSTSDSVRQGTSLTTPTANVKYVDKFGSLSRLDEEQLRLEAELEAVRRELDSYNNAVVHPRTSASSLHRATQPYHPLQDRHNSKVEFQDTGYHSPKRTSIKQRLSDDYDYGYHRGMGGENPYNSAHMMQLMLEQQARVYSKENELLRKEMEQLKDMVKDAARSRSRHHTPHHQPIIQAVPAPLHPSYVNYPFPSYPPPPHPAGVPAVPPHHPLQPVILPPVERTSSEHSKRGSHSIHEGRSTHSSSPKPTSSHQLIPQETTKPPSPIPVPPANLTVPKRKGFLGSLLNKKGAIIPNTPVVPVTNHKPTKLEVIDEDGSLTSREYSITPPNELQSTSPSPKPASFTPPRTPAKGDITSAIGIQLQYLRGLPSGTATVEVKGHQRNGQSVKIFKGLPLQHQFDSVEDKYVYSLHHFGFQQHEFSGVPMAKELILMIKVNHTTVAETSSSTATAATAGDEGLLCWTCLGLTVAIGDSAERQVKVNTGSYELPLFKPPLCKVADAEPDPDRHPPHGSQQYGSALIGIAVYTNNPPRPFANFTIDEYGPELKHSSAWVEVRRTGTPKQQFLQGDGFFLCVDGARHLPDNVTVSRVVGRIFNYSGVKVGLDIASHMKLDSSKYCPTYSLRQLFSEDNFPPTATAILKVYTLVKEDESTNKLMVVGYSALNIFVESGTTDQPGKDDVASTLSLNEGCFQLRLYHGSPNPELDYNVHMFDNHRYIPCASLLVRLEHVKASKIHAAKTAPAVTTIPNYNSGVYISESCMPTHSEKLLFDYVERHRKVVTIREAAVELFGRAEVQLFGNDKNFVAVLKGKLTRQVAQVPGDLGCVAIAAYDITHGFMVSVEHVDNALWKKLAHVIYFCSPPASYLEKQCKDFVFHTSNLDLDSLQRSPSWSDGFTHIEHRVYHSYMVVIFIVQCINMTSHGRKFTLGHRMWTPLQVFTDGYVNTDKFQLPLYNGIPNKRMIDLLASDDCCEVMREARSSHWIKLADGATLTVKISDSRRSDELKEPFPENHTYLPIKTKTKRKGIAKPLRDLLPAEIVDENKFKEDLLESFKEQILKLT